MAVVAVKVPVVEPWATLTDGGSVNPDIPLLLSITTAPPVGAGCESVTAQLLTACGPKVVGLHWREVIPGLATTSRLKLRLKELPL